ncbi:hypothetical protein ABLV87_13150 [Klebsiella sp. JB_Kp018]|uniref:hypothetical protein n=1 Tax=Klebsiella sp. JB_Kp018 TaxID=3153370 RepID=UPI0032B42099
MVGKDKNIFPDWKVLEQLVAMLQKQLQKKQMAKFRKKVEKLMRNEMLTADGFTEGCLALLEVKLILARSLVKPFIGLLISNS